MTPHPGALQAHSLQLLIRLGPARTHPWRRIAIDHRATLGDLHRAIQAACGWDDCHLHAFFSTSGPYVERGWKVAESRSEEGVPEPDDVPMATLLRRPGDRLSYVYDFGDNWCHEVCVEDVHAGASGRRLLGGALAFPPEDCGGLWCHDQIARLIRAKADGSADAEDLKELAEIQEWLGVWDPDQFDLEALAASFDQGALPGFRPMGAAAAGGGGPAFDVQPDPVLGHASKEALIQACHRAIAVVVASIPREPRGMSAFYSICDAFTGRLDDLAAHDPHAAAAQGLDFVQFIIEKQEEIPFDDDLDIRVTPSLLEAVRLEMLGERGVRRVRPLFQFVASIFAADHLETLARAPRELAKLPWTAAQRRRIVETLAQLPEDVRRSGGAPGFIGAFEALGP